MATIPTGGYPKMPLTNSVPLVFPAGDANQFNFVILSSVADEQSFNAGTGRFVNTPVAITTVSGPVSSSHGNNGWISGNWKK
jgi:hypothetical protein